MSETIGDWRRQKDFELKERLYANTRELSQRRLSSMENRGKDATLGRKLRKARARLLTVLKEKEVLSKD